MYKRLISPCRAKWLTPPAIKNFGVTYVTVARMDANTDLRKLKNKKNIGTRAAIDSRKRRLMQQLIRAKLNFSFFNAIRNKISKAIAGKSVK
jgi:hypothetical protein